MTTSRDDIFSTIQEVLVDALGVDDDEVTEESTLAGDLGAESIDFLDIVFRLEKNFDIKIPKGELFPENLALADSGYVQNGIVTTEGLELMREKMPFADVDRFSENPKIANIQDLFTVRMLVSYVESKMLTAV